MWSRAAFKQQAKNILSKSYWIAFLVCLLSGIITRGLSVGTNFNNLINRGSYSRGVHTGDFNNAFNLFNHLAIISTFIVIFLVVFVIVFALALAFVFFVAFPITVGKSKFFLENRKGNCDFSKLFNSFKSGQYINIVRSMAWRYLFTFLWSLLFIIPGIVKSYSYCMVPYILADNPNIGYDRALKLSMNMTSGYKFKIFVLQLSFLGWYLLGCICCVIGILFVNPYYEATFAEMYAALRKNAIEKAMCHPNELNLKQDDYILDYPSKTGF
jgi:uncharacterized membrane protein